jgi:CpeT protein
MNPLLKFAKILTGHFSNLNQAQENPKDFARINIYFMPLNFQILGKPALYSEQSYDHDPWNPYRQGFHNIEQKDEFFIVENFGYEQQQRVAGAGQCPKLLERLDPSLLQIRCGCAMHFKEVETDHYLGQVEPGKKCIVPRDGKLTYLVSEVELSETKWNSRDRGFDINTNQQCWGSEHGLLRFDRMSNLGSDLDENWIRKTG